MEQPQEQQEANHDVKLRQGTRVFKKSSPNGKITAYLGRRDFIDHLTHVDPIDGVVLVDPEYVKDRKVFVHVLAAFRYGREDLDVLGLTFRKDLFHSSFQIFPPPAEDASAGERRLTRLQERLVKKLGQHAYPFRFDLPAQQSPASVTLQPGPNDSGKPCGVDYELKAYVADSEDGKSHKRSTVKLAIRKLTYAPAEPGPQPSAEARESLGIVVSYRVKVRLVLGFGASDISVELPFILTHPKPSDSDATAADEPPTAASCIAAAAGVTRDSGTPGAEPVAAAEAVDPDLIHLDTAEPGNPADDDLIFEDFARLRLQGCCGGAQTDDEA